MSTDVPTDLPTSCFPDSHAATRPTAESLSNIETVLCDLDGVVWLAHHPIAGSVEAISALQRAGRRVLFVTNNSSATIATQERALADVGIAAIGDVVSSAMAAALLLEPGQRALVAGGPGVVESLEARGVTAIVNDGELDASSHGSFDAVVAGLHRDFDYRRLAVAARALHGGARLIGTNADPTYPTLAGLDPGGGSILAAIATAGGVVPEVAGKPYAPMAQVIAELLATEERPFDPERVVMVGDRMDTDGMFALQVGCRFALVRSGSTPPGALVPDLPEGSLDVADLDAVAGVILG
jgi:HAD superfamily hydrolase (TIGR01450 family)